MNQRTLAGFEKYGKVTRRAQFLADMDRVMPWDKLIGLVRPHYPAAGEQGGRPPCSPAAGPKEELQSAAIEIYDPTLGERYTLIPETKTALGFKAAPVAKFEQPPFAPATITARWGGLTIGPNEQGWSQPESLGGLDDRAQ